jgi:hypothetical protein
MSADVVTPTLPGGDIVAPSGRANRVPRAGASVVWRPQPD